MTGLTFARRVGETVTFIRAAPGGVDDNGDPVAGTETRTEVERCSVVPRTSSEVTDQGRQGVIVGLTVYAPASAVVGPHDRLEVRGELYDVDGEPGYWVSQRTGHPAGWEIAAKRVEG